MLQNKAVGTKAMVCKVSGAAASWYNLEALWVLYQNNNSWNRALNIFLQGNDTVLELLS